MLARVAGLSCGKEVRNLMLHSGKRPDVAILGALRSITAGVRTVVGADPRYCAAAVFPGHGAVWGAMRKNEAWLEHTITQGGAFYALYHEAGGRMGDFAYDFLGMVIDSAGGSASDRMAFKVYALQRLHAADFRGVAAVIKLAGDSHGAWCPPRAWPAAPGDRPPLAHHQL